VNIVGFTRMPLNDWDGMVTATVYVAGCDFRCPDCPTPELVPHDCEYEPVPENEVLRHMTEHAGFLDGIVIHGGEPLVQSDLEGFLSRVRSTGAKTNLVTNGTQPTRLEALVERRLVDFVTLKLRGPLSHRSYEKCAGLPRRQAWVVARDVHLSVALLLERRVDHEFRLRVHPALHSESDLAALTRQLGGSSRLVLYEVPPRRSA